MKRIISVAALLVFMTVVPGVCGELEDLFASIEALGIQCQGYTLCAPLSQAQQAHAQTHMEETNSPKVYRFRDGNLHIVADRKTHRVLVMFEQFNTVGQQDVQDLVGDLFMKYGDPAVSAHDKVVYWAWGRKGKVTADQYKAAKEKKNQLNIIATVKLNSDISIMKKAENQARGDMYYIISSDPLLRFFN